MTHQFIEVTKLNGSKMLLNWAFIASVEPANEKNKGSGPCYIYLGGEESVEHQVKESYEDIYSMLPTPFRFKPA